MSTISPTFTEPMIQAYVKAHDDENGFISVDLFRFRELLETVSDEQINEAYKKLTGFTDQEGAPFLTEEE